MMYKVPICKYNGRVVPCGEPQQQQRLLINTEAGAYLWEQLHKWAARSPLPVLDQEVWFDLWENVVKVFLGNCGCWRDWQRIKRENPMRWGEEAFAWSVEVHNEVNNRLGKRVLTLEEARAKFFPSEP